ncbi:MULTISPECIES: DUF423 domain-containing protein [Komagataeibacter]|uniref:DUF423 domain-containing protein n=2 Tax=Komagataeibacter TaxID=1434011 RepID=A0A318QTL3_9PROT|nr:MULTISPECIES: DUF423 domain-containing protein [Komagataeibacter]GBR36248.1 hypothetical protein AA11826_1505 [Komagataeibacter oboediens DSM 11826]MBL7233835.1 DUF423 domain-containing protein [Komagataeibacter oboediens]MBT0674814.1 DUF423 domain-containing protein [Komagataeibacter oboediens]MBT0678638.1 DUF423 domain-containing protein [Komagataeibacter oboediens]MBV1822504.1 DUF423 domain-containing protein [Komagataeibacter oboediens]
MPTVVRFLLCFAALAAFSGVMGGALTAHLPDRFFAEGGREMARQAIQMQMWHALAIIGISVLMIQQGCRVLVSVSGCLMAVGTVLFSTGVALTAFWGIHPGPVAPTGGSMLMLAWLLLAVGVMRS